MKYAKIIGLFALTAVAAMAMAASASATTVCSGQGTGPACAVGAHGKQFTGTIHATGTATLTVTTSGGATARTVHCNSSVHGHVTSAAGHGTITSLLFTTCTATKCEKVSASTPRTGGPAFPWTATITATGNTNGQLHVATPSGKFTATCNDLGFPVTATCEYEATTATANVIGGTPAKVEAKGVVLTKTAGSELVCGAKADWDGTYTVTTPASLTFE